MLKLIGGVVAGLVAWIVLVSALDWVLRNGWHDYAAVEKSMAFTIPMMVTRLAMSATCSLAAGYVAARLDKRAPLIAGTILLLLFIPVHYSMWDKFPIWYHLTFLTSLPLASLVGGKLLHARSRVA
jgi:hypothetical protein